MVQLQNLLGENAARWAVWIGLGLAVIIALLLVFLIARRLFGPAFNMAATADRRGRPSRLGVTDFFNLDRNGRRLVIVRRDNVEHLVLVGGPNDVVIESGIVRGIRPEIPVQDTTFRPTVASRATDPELAAEQAPIRPRQSELPLAAERRDETAISAPPAIAPSSTAFAREPAPASYQRPPVVTLPPMPRAQAAAVSPPAQTVAAAPRVAEKPMTSMQPVSPSAPVWDTKPADALAALAKADQTNKAEHARPQPAAEPKPSEIKPAIQPVKPPEAISQTLPDPTKTATETPLRRPLPPTLGDVSRRLEEALRAPPSFSTPPAAAKTAEPVQPLPSSSTPTTLDPVKSEPTKVEAVKTGSMKMETAKSEPIKSDPIKSEPAKTGSETVESYKPDPQKAQKLDPFAKLEAIKTDAGELDLEKEMARLLGRSSGGGS